MAKRIGSRTIELTEDVRVAASAAVAGKKEGEGPLKDCFDYVSQDSYFAEDSWEKAETSMLRQCFGICRGKAGGAAFEPECVLGGDLLNQCVSSSFALKDSGLPYLGLYGACSTMAEALCLAALLIDGGGFKTAAALTGSHFCTAVPFPARIRRAAHTDEPMDCHGFGLRDALQRRTRPAHKPRDAGQDSRRGDNRREQHGRGDGARGV